MMEKFNIIGALVVAYSVVVYMFSRIAMDLLVKRYLQRGETPYEMFDRVASDIASVESDYEYWRKKFYDAMVKLEFLPNSPCLFNAGTGNGLSYSACYALPIEDSIESIFDTLKHSAIIFKSGGGVGYNFGKLRPKGDMVRGSMGVSSGVISFMKIYNETIEQIRQGGKRRGASIAILPVTHPEIKNFITAKWQEGILRNFNISVLVTDEFMRAVESDSEWKLINPRDGGVWETVRAREIFDLIVECAWRNGEPGVLFYDTINIGNTCPHLGAIEVTNPCSEVPLRYYESCNLGSIDVSKFVSGDSFDWKRLEDVVRTGVRFLDDVIDAQPYTLQIIETETKRTRKIGLGIMGWHDALIKLGIPYDSGDAIMLAHTLMGFIRRVAISESVRIAEEKGVFPAWRGSEWEKKGIKIRNATLLSIAPTGSLSIIANCSPSIEPVFNWVYVRDNTVDSSYFVVHELFKEVLIAKGVYCDDVLMQVLRDGGVQSLDCLSEEEKRIFKNALDIDWRWHIRMQATFQQYVDNGISKTINMRSTATKYDVARAIFMAWREGCKGITIYRAGSRSEEVYKCSGDACHL